MRVSTHVVTAVALLVAAGCSAPATRSEAAAWATSGVEWLVDAAADAGLAFRHVNGMSGRYYEPEIVGPGAALFDYDNDGDLDAYLVQGQMLGNATHTGPPLGDRLFRNDLAVNADGARTVRFTDVTAASGIDTRSHGMGVATGDVDNDGWTDLYLTRVGASVLLRNNGDGTFADVSTQAGVASPAWAVSAAFVDMDRDGWLDLYVAGYLSYSLASDISCTTPAGWPDYCPSNVYPAARSRLLHNERNGTFRDVSATALSGGSNGHALGVTAADLDGDSWLDIVVATDRQENELWINQRNGTFVNTAPIAGIARGSDGLARGSRGVAAADADNDGDEDLLVVNDKNEGTVLYVNSGAGRFDDAAVRSTLAGQTMGYSGFGAGWFDIDNDGWLDVLTVNGAATRRESISPTPFPYAHPSQLLLNLQQGKFSDGAAHARKALSPRAVGRGAAFGDVDNDGDVDVLVANNNAPARLLINAIGSRNHWVGLRLVGAGGRDMLGARVELTRADGVTLSRRATTGGSYASAGDPRVIVGLGTTSTIRTVRVVWPSGAREEWDPVAVDRWSTLREGTGR